MINNKRKGISLIVLVITIIVIIVLAVAVIVTIAKNNPIENARKAREDGDVATLKEYLSMGIADMAITMSLEGSPLKINDRYVDLFKSEFPDAKEVERINSEGELTGITTKLHDKKFLITEFSKIEYLVDEKKVNVDVEKNNVAEMVADSSLKVGDVVNTLGYYTVGDGGNSVYNIVDSSTPDVRGEVITLDNGTKAKLQIQEKTLDVKQFGAVGDGTTDESDLLQYTFDYLLKNDVDKITLASGDYVVGSRIKLHTGNYQGKDGAKIKITLLDNDYCFHNSKGLWETYENQGDGYDYINIDNIDFSYFNHVEGKENINMKMIRFDNTKDSSITNCNFYTEAGNYNGVCALDMYTNNKGLTISDCNFKLYSTNTNNNALITAICIREYRNNKVSENINILNCNMEKNGWDETVWLDGWIGTLKDVTMDNCKVVDNGSAITTLWVGASRNNSQVLNTTIKNSTFEKENFSYVLANVGVKGTYNSQTGVTETGKTDNITFLNNTVNIKSVLKENGTSKVKAGATIFLNAYGLTENGSTSNIKYDRITVNTNESIANSDHSASIFRDFKNSAKCNNITLDAITADYIFYDINEVVGVTANNPIKSHIFVNPTTVKDITLEVADKWHNFLNLYSYQGDEVHIDNLDIKCNDTFIYGTITDSAPNYYDVYVTNSKIDNQNQNLFVLNMQPGQENSSEVVTLYLKNNEIKTSWRNSTYPNRINRVDM